MSLKVGIVGVLLPPAKPWEIFNARTSYAQLAKFPAEAEQLASAPNIGKSLMLKIGIVSTKLDIMITR